MPTRTVESYIESFPNPSITKQIGEPTRNKIQDVYELLSANASSIESSREGGNHGLLFITHKSGKHLALTGHTLMPLTNPGPVPAMPGGVRATKVTALEKTHKHNLQEHNEHKKVSKAIIQKLINAFEPQGLRHLKTPHTGFNNTTVKVALNHLHDTRRAVATCDLDRNSENMKTP